LSVCLSVLKTEVINKSTSIEPFYFCNLRRHLQLGTD
jgi:hypothetical protein